jgi:Flp pilus assembly protein TadD
MLGVGVFTPGCKGEAPPKEERKGNAATAATQAARERARKAELNAEEGQKIKAYCTQCHGMDPPSRFTMQTWGRAIDYMYRLLDDHLELKDGRPEKALVMGYFERNAAQVVQAPENYPLYQGTRRFRRESLGLREDGAIVADLTRGRLGKGKKEQILLADLLSGHIMSLEGEGYSEPRGLVRADHPARVSAADLDGDGRQDLLVAELGTFLAVDGDRGKAIWFRNSRKGKYERIVIAQGLGRVSDVQASDVDGDGDLDVLIAEFGWQKTGRLTVLERVGGKGSKLEFKTHEIQPGHGATRVEAADLDGDGDKDLVALFSQELEMVVVYENVGGLQFTRHEVFKAGTPLWGMIGMELVDIDQDGDVDILHFNGDNLDSPKLAAFQGVYLLRNDGGLKFTNQKLATLPGAHDVSVADLDADGDPDLIAVASLPPLVEMTTTATPVAMDQLPRTDAVLFIENLGLVKGTPSFRVWAIEKTGACHSAVMTDDYDGDGDIDVLLGSFRLGWEILNHDLGGRGGPAMSARCPGQYDLVLLHNENAGATMAGRSAGPVERGLTPWESKSALQEQVAAYHRLIETHPKDAIFPNRLGKLLHELGRLPEALIVLRQATKNAPDHEAVWSNLATTLNNLGRHADALEAGSESVRLDPEYATGHSVRAVSLSKLGRTLEAVAAGKRSVELAPDHLPFRVNQANFLLWAGQHQEALKELEAARTLAPDNPMVNGLLDRVRQILGQSGASPPSGLPASRRPPAGGGSFRGPVPRRGGGGSRPAQRRPTSPGITPAWPQRAPAGSTGR